jgi:hypothetical protein
VDNERPVIWVADDIAIEGFEEMISEKCWSWRQENEEVCSIREDTPKELM